MVNAAFSVVLGEMEDLSAGVFDHRGVMLAQSVQGAPGHLGSLGIGLKHIIAAFDESSLAPGDIQIPVRRNGVWYREYSFGGIRENARSG